MDALRSSTASLEVRRLSFVLPSAVGQYHRRTLNTVSRWRGSVMVERWSCDHNVVGSTSGRVTVKWLVYLDKTSRYITNS